MMDASNPTGKCCGQCGMPLPADAPKGVCPQCELEGALGMLGDGSETTKIGTPCTADASHSPPHQFGNYELLEEIARGGMGVVYKARQRGLDRIVAVKMILVERFGGKQSIQRFRGEAAAAGVLQHPNIVAIHEIGMYEGQHFFSMDYVEGQNLAQLVGHRPLPALKAAHYVKLIAEAVHYAHEQGILHRDLKPSNVLIDAATDQPRVTDFGLAKRLASNSSLTMSGQVLGSPNFMPPEQAGSGRGKVGRPSDVFGLGGILYFLLTARAPFQGESLEATISQVLNTEPVSPRLLNPSLPLDLETICLKSLEKVPARRYATAQDVADELGRFLDDKPILARPVGRSEKVWRWCRRKPLVATLSLAVTALLLVVLIGSPIAAWRINRARQLAQVRELEARRTAYASDMNLVQQALAQDNLGRARELLYRHRPANESEIRNPKSEIDLRNWEWRYLWQHCQSEAKYTLCQGSNVVLSLAVSHDGNWLAVGEGSRGGLSIWDLRTRQQVTRLVAGEALVRLAFSPRELLLAFTCSTQVNPRIYPAVWKDRVRLWDGRTRQVLREIETPGPCRGLAFSEDGQTLIASTRALRVSSAILQEDALTLWRVHDGQRLAGYPANQIAPNVGTPFAVARDLSIAIHPLPSLGSIRAVDLVTGREKWTANALDDAYTLTALALSPDAKVVASAAGYTDYPIRLWDVASGQEIGPLEGHRACIFSMVFWPDGKTLAGASADQTIRLWDLTDLHRPRSLRTLRGHQSEVGPLVLLPDHTTLVSGCKDGSVCVWDTKAIQRERTHVTLPEPILTWRVASDRKSVLTVDRQGRVVQWKGIEWQERELVMDIGTNFWAAGISPNGQRLVASSDPGIVRVWDLDRKALLPLIKPGSDEVYPLGFVRGGDWLLTHDRADFLREWDVITGNKSREWKVGGSRAAGFSEDAHWLITIDRDSTATLLDLNTGHKTMAKLGVKDVGGWVVFSPDGGHFAAASQSGYAKIWETTTLREVALIHGFVTAFHSVAFSPDGRRLALASGGKGTIILWDVEAHQELLTLEGRGSLFGSTGPTAFSPDGNILGSVNGNGILHLWRAPSWEEIERQEKAAQAKREP